MAAQSAQDITGLLRAWSEGDESALDSLIPLLYDDLHRTAHSYMAREAPDNTLQTTALVNEVYLRLHGARDVDWQNRGHFLAVCATVMRRILTDFARARRSLKRGGTAGTFPWMTRSSSRIAPGSICWSSTRHSRIWRPSIHARPAWWSCGFLEA